MAFIMRDDNVFPEDFKKIWHEAHETVTLWVFTVVESQLMRELHFGLFH